MIDRSAYTTKLPLFRSLGLLVFLALAACPKGAKTTSDPKGISAIASSMSSVTLDSAASRKVPGCEVPLTGLLHKNSKSKDGWDVTWDQINAHIATIQIAPGGERDHVLKPVIVRNGDTVKASIDPIRGTERLTEAQSIEALTCGRIIARITSNGDHDTTTTKIAAGTNYLVIAMQPVSLPGGKWVFVIINPRANYRASLPRFKYTPHYSYDMPTFSALGKDIRRSITGPTSFSRGVQDCFEKGYRACFIDPAPEAMRRPGGHGAFHGLGTSGTVFWQGGGFGSQPWVPCPLYGCCCGGDACHGDG